LGQLESANGDVLRACGLLEQSIEQARTIGDQRMLSMALRHLSVARRSVGDHVGAQPLIEEAVAVSRADGYAREIAWNLNTLAVNLAHMGREEGIEQLLAESIALGRCSGDLTPVISSMGALEQLYLKQGNLERARHIANECLALARDLDLPFLSVNVYVMLGDLAVAEKAWESAHDWYRQALRVETGAAGRGVVAHALRHYASLVAALGDPHTAVRIFGAASPVHDFPASTLIQLPVSVDRLLAAARRELGDTEFAAIWAEGESVGVEQAVAEILDRTSAQQRDEPGQPKLKQSQNRSRLEDAPRSMPN
jgi:tetratricopeptide (TPR) repeat protein